MKLSHWVDVCDDGVAGDKANARKLSAGDQ